MNCNNFVWGQTGPGLIATSLRAWGVQMSTYSAFRLKLTDYGMSPVKAKFKKRPKPKLLSSGAFSSAVTCSLSTFTPVFGL